MDVGSILLILALALLAGAYIALPVVRDESREVSEAEMAHSALLAERERVLEALLELDFDYELGKVPEEIYPEQRARLVSKATDVMAKLDASDAAMPATQDAVEAAVAARKRPAADGDDPIEALIAKRRGTASDVAKAPAAAPAVRKVTTGAGFCPQCGTAVKQGDKFCVACGTALA